MLYGKFFIFVPILAKIFGSHVDFVSLFFVKPFFPEWIKMASPVYLNFSTSLLRRIGVRLLTFTTVWLVVWLLFPHWSICWQQGSPSIFSHPMWASDVTLHCYIKSTFFRVHSTVPLCGLSDLMPWRLVVGSSEIVLEYWSRWSYKELSSACGPYHLPTEDDLYMFIASVSTDADEVIHPSLPSSSVIWS